MTSLVDRLRESRENASVLHIQIMKLRGRYNGAIFIFEGPDDVPVYEEILNRIPSCPQYEPIPANGKKQVLRLLETLGSRGADQLRGIYFFIDRDFDPPAQPHPHLHELDQYSVETLLCTAEVLESLLKDEYRCTGDVDAREAIQQRLRKFFDDLNEHCSEVNLRLFEAQRTGRKVLKKPERISQIVAIDLDNVSLAYRHIDEVFSSEPSASAQELDVARQEFNALASGLRQRGKYQIEAFRKWLKALADDRRRDAPKAFASSVDKIGDATSASLRRFACAAPVPDSLVRFCAAM